MNPNTISAQNIGAYTWNIEVDILSGSEIKFIKSSSHEITYELSKNKLTAKVKLNNAMEFPNKDFNLLFRNEDINMPSASIGFS